MNPILGLLNYFRYKDDNSNDKDSTRCFMSDNICDRDQNQSQITNNSTKTTITNGDLTDPDVWCNKIKY